MSLVQCLAQSTYFVNVQEKETKAGIKIAGRNINNLRYADDTPPMAERRTKEPLDKSERRE